MIHAVGNKLGGSNVNVQTLKDEVRLVCLPFSIKIQNWSTFYLIYLRRLQALKKLADISS